MSIFTGTVLQLGNLLGELDDPSRNAARERWDSLSRIPGGKRLFSFFAGRAAPYTGTIGAQVLEIRRGYSKVLLEDRPAVRNHLRCIHAVALVNLAELAGNIALAYSLPPDGRFIVAGLSIDYLKKARGAIVGEGFPPEITSSERREYAVPVRMSDGSGEVVAQATLRTLVGPKKPTKG